MWMEKIQVKVMKVGIIRCQQTEIYCPASACIYSAANGEGGFAETGPVEVIGINSCGGCPGKQIYARALEMKNRGAERIALASCITQGAPAYLEFPCPFASKLKKIIDEKVEIESIDHTH
jgi:predicted metal-binding protein